jgi:hypothetical protein
MGDVLRTLVMAAVLTVVAVPATLADDVTTCGAAQLKVYAKLFKTLIKEATRACSAGSAGNPVPLNDAFLTAAADKAAAGFEKAIARFGQANCFVGDSTAIPVPQDVIDAAQGIADDLCSPPTPTPAATPTP